MASGPGVPVFDPVVAEYTGQRPEGLLLGSTQDNPMDHLGAPGDVESSSLHVQRAVRHQPVTDDHGLFVQRAVRASQLESALRHAVADAVRWESLSPMALLGPWPLAPQAEAGTGEAAGTTPSAAPGFRNQLEASARVRLASAVQAATGSCQRNSATSFDGGAPNERRYSRLNWDGLS
jgi:hypothetical protein